MIPIVLGSGSAIRARILSDAGVTFEAVKPSVDEAALKRAWPNGEADPAGLAQHLADAKALNVSAQRPDALVIGADQILVFDGRAHDKASSVAEARDRLIAMRARSHELVSGLCLAQGGEIVERIPSTSRLEMRAFSDAFLDCYLDRAGPDVLSSVGVYQFEGLGAQLFETVRGDYFAILGLDLVPLLRALRRLGALPS